MPFVPLFPGAAGRTNAKDTLQNQGPWSGSDGARDVYGPEIVVGGHGERSSFLRSYSVLLSWGHRYQRVFETPENTATAIEEFARNHGTTASALKVLRCVRARARRADPSFFARQCVAWPVLMPWYLCRTRWRKSLIVWTRRGIAAKDVDTQGRCARF
jgi:hypothetical protein